MHYRKVSSSQRLPLLHRSPRVDFIRETGRWLCMQIPIRIRDLSKTTLLAFLRSLFQPIRWTHHLTHRLRTNHLTHRPSKLLRALLILHRPIDDDVAHMNTLRTELARNRLRYSSGDELAAGEDTELGRSPQRGCCASKEEGRGMLGGNVFRRDEERENCFREEKCRGAEIDVNPDGP